MTVYIDVSAAVNSRAGLGRYARSLTDALLQEMPNAPTLFYNRTPQAHIPDQWTHVPQRSIRMAYKPWRMMVWQGQLTHASFQRLVPGVQVFHATEHLLMPLGDVPTVMTVHDLIYKLFPQHHKRLNYYFLNAAMPLFVKRANAIITVSQATKNDLMRYYGTPDQKITVVHEAASPNFRVVSPGEVARVRQKYDLPAQYMLVVGTVEPRKNLSRLVEVLARLRRDFPDLQLVVVGAKGWLYEDFFKRIQELNLTDAVNVLGYVPDEDLPGVFRAAVVYVMASVYEGAGLPVLEAMACGVPVASSRESSLPELGADVPHYFNPHDVNNMTEVLGIVLSDARLRAEMAAAGPERAARFSWKRAAVETLRVYRKLVQ
ncbi:MAG TPA: glycosyltransferase family 1 protein [Aggregatilinea sp.]|uniref:glycosyltransferase family 4 protein n=1 Tax=Aggregatilinea sp. TaxID=2806333 RepID=UPI002C7E8317|nr:glycosyltransferase family 1 protein [Aggregatilinea sp.]HML20488.1 glycosyltransferase family 1 protein [Aggregatilinea sp.]